MAQKGFGQGSLLDIGCLKWDILINWQVLEIYTIKQQNFTSKGVFWVKQVRLNVNTVFIRKDIVLADCLDINSAATK